MFSGLGRFMHYAENNVSCGIQRKSRGIRYCFLIQYWQMIFILHLPALYKGVGGWVGGVGGYLMVRLSEALKLWHLHFQLLFKSIWCGR